MLSLLAMLVASPASAFERYQAVVIQEGPSPRVFLLDTRDGHMWSWSETIRGSDQELRYEGKLRPGKEPGELIYRSDSLRSKRVPEGSRR